MYIDRESVENLAEINRIEWAGIERFGFRYLWSDDEHLNVSLCRMWYAPRIYYTLVDSKLNQNVQ